MESDCITIMESYFEAINIIEVSEWRFPTSLTENSEWYFVIRGVKY